MKAILSVLGFAGLIFLFGKRREDIRNNRYFPVQSDSERIAGHPIVGVS